MSAAGSSRAFSFSLPAAAAPLLLALALAQRGLDAGLRRLALLGGAVGLGAVLLGESGDLSLTLVLGLDLREEHALLRRHLRLLLQLLRGDALSTDGLELRDG